MLFPCKFTWNSDITHRQNKKIFFIEERGKEENRFLRTANHRRSIYDLAVCCTPCSPCGYYFYLRRNPFLISNPVYLKGANIRKFSGLTKTMFWKNMGNRIPFHEERTLCAFMFYNVLIKTSSNRDRSTIGQIDLFTCVWIYHIR